jgi:hypothetical protein
VYRAYSRDALHPRGCAGDHIGVVTMAVDDAGVEFAHERTELAVLAQVASRSNHNRSSGNAERLKPNDKWVAIRIVGHQHRRDVNTRALLLYRHHRDYLLSTTLTSRGYNVENGRALA